PPPAHPAQETAALATPALGVLVAGEMQIVHRDVHLDHGQATNTLDPLDHVLPQRRRHTRNRLAILNDHNHVDRRLLLTHLDRDTTAALIPQTNPVRHRTNSTARPATKLPHTRHLTGGNTRHLLNHRIGDRGRPPRR